MTKTKHFLTVCLLGLLLDYTTQNPLQQEVMSPGGGARARRPPRLLRRKRGWVWNQFFVLEEYLGPDPQYVGKLHTDLDYGDQEVRYTLSGEGAGTIFTVDQITGDIHALVGLDREEKAFYTLKAQVVDFYTGVPLEPQSTFIIKVQDINDNVPRFLDAPYTASVPERSPAGTFITQVTAVDADDTSYGHSARIIYSLLEGQPYFTVDPKTGVIRTALANLDREVQAEYRVLVQAKDMGGQQGGLASSTGVNISLEDVNDNPPRFNQSVFHLGVPESASVGSAVGRIQAHDPDVGPHAEVDYTIVPGEEGDVFDIVLDRKSHDGVLVLKKTLDYETKKSYTFKVEASNPDPDPRFLHVGPFMDTALVRVSVLDVNEAPVFTKTSYTMEVYEDTPPGTIIGSVTAHDLDLSSSAVRYSLDWRLESDGCFDIDTVEGTVSTNEFLDRETNLQHNVSVVATKVNDPLLTSRVQVTVNVLDVNEFPPELTAPSETFICEDSRVGQVVQTVGAVDLDRSPLGQRFFFKTPKELRNRNFTVRDYGNNTAGVVSRRSSFPRYGVYLLPVVVEDSGYPAQSSTSTLTLSVCSCRTGSHLTGSHLTGCSAHGRYLSVGVSAVAMTTATIAAALLMVLVLVYVTRVQRRRPPDGLMRSKEDLRDNVVHYNEEGGGESDTRAFNMGTLRCSQTPPSSSTSSASRKERSSSASRKERSSSASRTERSAGGYGRGVLPHLNGLSDRIRSPDVHRGVQDQDQDQGDRVQDRVQGDRVQGERVRDLLDKERDLLDKDRVQGDRVRDILDQDQVRDLLARRLEEGQRAYGAPPYDSLATYAYEGQGSAAGSLSSIEGSWILEDNFSSLGDWGGPFKTLRGILDHNGH